jgi:peroxiredoxin
MRRLILFLSLCWCVCTRLYAQGTDIQFQLKGAPSGTYKIIGMFGGQNYLADSLVYQSGPLRWQRKEPVAGGLYYFVFPDQQTFVQLLLDKDQVFTVVGDKADPIGTIQIDGSIDNALFYENQRWEQRFKARLDSSETALKSLPQNSPNRAYLDNLKNQLLASRKSLLESYKAQHPTSFFTVFKLAGQNPDLQSPQLPGGGLDTIRQIFLYRNAYWKNTDLGDERLYRTPVVPNKLKTYMTQITPQSTDSVIKSADIVTQASMRCGECYKYIANWIAIQYEKPTFMGGDAILVHMVDKYFTDANAHWFKDKPEDLAKIRKKVNDMRPSLVGKIGQDLRCRNVAGQYENLYDLKGKAKIVFMYSVTCSHCQERTPVLRSVYDQWHPLGLEVYALCLDPDEDKWKEFVTKYHIEPFHNVIDPKYESLYYRKYHADITPELYILDENNKIVAKDLHPDQVGTILEKLYGRRP